jgi:hypothetical protein
MSSAKIKESALVTLFVGVLAILSVQGQDRETKRELFKTQSCDVSKIDLDASVCACDRSVEWLDYCLLIGIKKSKKGDTLVLRDFIENTSGETLKKPEPRDIEDSFNFEIFNSLGMRILSNYEILAEKCRRTNDARPCYSLLRNHPRNFCLGGPCDERLLPFTPLQTHLDRKGLYSFKVSGTYTINVTSRIEIGDQRLKFQFSSLSLVIR